MFEEIKKLSHDYFEKTVNLRRELHENPELSSREYQTAKRLKAIANSWGLKVEEVANSTGFTVLLDTGRPGKTLGIRTDLDALPIQESSHNLKRKRVTQSQNEGVMHACGHDGHMAIVIAVMKIMLDIKDSLRGKIYFIFEEGEEIGSGIQQMLDHLKEKKIDAIYGNHMAAFLETGKVSLDPGPVMAGASMIDFSVIGQGGHGSRPDKAINPIFAAANILVGLTSAGANQVDVTETVTLGISQLEAGNAYNVIPDEARIGGSLRFFNLEEGQKAKKVLESIAQSTAQAHRCEIRWEETQERPIHPPVYNDPSLSKLGQEAIHNINENLLTQNVQWFASESFARYQEIAPTCFAFIGTKNDAYGSGAEHHNEYFDLDEDSLFYGVQATASFAYHFLNRA